MCNNKHLTLDDRLIIERELFFNSSFKKIGKLINKDCTTVSKEIRNHVMYRNSGAVGRPFFDCANRYDCPHKIKGVKCNTKTCPHYKKEICDRLSKPPYVCNGCPKRNICTLSKQLYDAAYANREYKENLIETRSGIVINQNEINNLNQILVPLISERGQSIHQAYINNPNKIMYSEKTLYKIIDLGLLEVRNIDLPRKVRFKQRVKNNTTYKIDKECLTGRTYEDFIDYLNNNADTSIVQMDTVIGKQGGKCLLTIHFVNTSFMLAFLREHNDAQSVIDIFNNIQKELKIDKFKELFPLILTDNGSEFSNPTEIEFDMKTGELRTQIFYCHPSSPFEKGSCEVNHELLRRILQKGTSFDNLTQEDINLIMSHVNSYKRKKLNNESPYSIFSKIYGEDTINKLGIIKIEPNEVSLTTKLIKK